MRLFHQQIDSLLKEIAWRNGFITANQFEQLAHPLYKNGYGQYMMRLLREGIAL